MLFSALAVFASATLSFEADASVMVAERFRSNIAILDSALHSASWEVQVPCKTVEGRKLSLIKKVNTTANANKTGACTSQDALKEVSGILSSMYGRFKSDIVEASRVEDQSKKFFKGKTGGETAMSTQFEKTRAASHEHYRAMLKVAHSGMDRILTAMGLVNDSLAGKKIDMKQLKELKASMPATSASKGSPANVTAGIKQDLLQYCKEAQKVLGESHSAKIIKKAVSASQPKLSAIKASVQASKTFQKRVEEMEPALCGAAEEKHNTAKCTSYVQELLFCLEIAKEMPKLVNVDGAKEEETACKKIDKTMPAGISLFSRKIKGEKVGFLQKDQKEEPAPEDQLAKEMSHDLEMNFNKIAPFGKEDTAKELQDHAADTQDTLVDAVENAEVAEIKRAVFRALTRLRAATIKEFDTIARLETQAIDAYNDAHHYRAENPLSHLHEDEAPVETDKLKSFH
jgi:hypothetical protein